LSNLNIDYMSAMVSFERLFEVLDLVPMIKESPDAVVMPDGAAELIFNHVDFSYPGAEEVHWPRWRRSRDWTTRRAPTCSTTSRSASNRAR